MIGKDLASPRYWEMFGERGVHMDRELMPSPKEVADTVAALVRERDEARRTAQFWKAEHLTGNALIECLRAERDALKSQLDSTPPTNWQPISTAPKDGAAILAYADGVQTTVEWRTGGDGYFTVCVPGYLAADGEWWPTHWEPLGEGPAQAAPEATKANGDTA